LELLHNKDSRIRDSSSFLILKRQRVKNKMPSQPASLAQAQKKGNFKSSAIPKNFNGIFLLQVQMPKFFLESISARLWQTMSPKYLHGITA
jgi:hypothetical protein